MYSKIEKCRICGNANLTEVLDLGIQALTGVFPKVKNQAVTAGPLKLVKCVGGADVCGLLQLQHSYDLAEMYGLNYGYRSGLNASMVTHLHGKVKRILERVPLEDSALIIDIGSNDSTTLQAYPAERYTLVGIDPTGTKFKNYYPDHIRLIPDFFSASKFKEQFGDHKASVITSFSMFYDLEDPVAFMQGIFDVLEDNGVWVFEQSYMPTMLDRNSYDTVCHEHLEYYTLKQIKWMADKVGLKIIDVEFNDINGGSFSVTAAKQSSKYTQSPMVSAVLKREIEQQLDTLSPYREFENRVKQSREELISFVNSAKHAGKKVAALGASTKGNVVLQYCGIGDTDISCVGEVNVEKYDCYTPGTLLPIIPQEELLRKGFDYLIVLPWHFRSFFEKNPALAGASLVFPLPNLEVVST